MTKFRLTPNMKLGILALIISLLAGVTAVGIMDDVPEADPTDGVQVFVAREVIAVGSTLGSIRDAGVIQSQIFPAQTVPTGSISSIDDVNANLVALSTIQPGQILLSSNFATSLRQLPFDLEDGHVAITLDLNDTARVSTFVQPGSRVAVFVTTDIAASQPRTRLLLKDVLVVGIGSTASKSDVATVSSLVTVSVTQIDAQRLIQLLTRGAQLRLALVDDSGSLDLGLITSDATVFR